MASVDPRGLVGFGSKLSIRPSNSSASKSIAGLLGYQPPLGSSTSQAPEEGFGASLKVLLLSIVVICTGVGNDVAGKIMTVPMGAYSFLLGAFSAFAYCLFYACIILVRTYFGMAAPNQLASIWLPRWKEANFFSRIPKVKYFIAMGILDGIAALLTNVARPFVGGQLVVLLPQSALLFCILFGFIILRTKYSYWQLWTVLVVIAGVMVTLLGDAKSKFGGGSLIYLIVLLLSPAPFALSFVLKERLFQQMDKLDLFVVAFHSSLFQFLFQPLFMPLAFLIIPDLRNGMGPLAEIQTGLTCFIGTTPAGVKTDCSPMPIPYLIYIVFNIGFNVAILALLKIASAVMSFMVIRAVLPLSVCMYFFAWPLLPNATEFNFYVIIGLLSILIAIVFFRLFSQFQVDKQLSCCSVELPCCYEDGDEKSGCLPVKNELDIQVSYHSISNEECEKVKIISQDYLGDVARTR